MAGEGLQPRPPFQRLQDTNSKSAAGICSCTANASKPCVSGCCVCVCLSVVACAGGSKSAVLGDRRQRLSTRRALPCISPRARAAQDLVLPRRGSWLLPCFPCGALPGAAGTFRGQRRWWGAGIAVPFGFQETEALPGARKKGGSLQPISRVCWAVWFPPGALETAVRLVAPGSEREALGFKLSVKSEAAPSPVRILIFRGEICFSVPRAVVRVILE